VIGRSKEKEAHERIGLRRGETMNKLRTRKGEEGLDC